MPDSLNFDARLRQARDQALGGLAQASSFAGSFLERLARRVGMDFTEVKFPLPDLPASPLPVQPAPPLGQGQFVTREFTNQAGTRLYKLYIPAGRARAPRPLIVMLHGCRQTPDDFAAGTRMNELADEYNLLIAYPAQSAAANPSRCWNWFKPEDQVRGSGEPGLIAGIIGQIAEEHTLDRARIYVAGLSAGGAQAAILAAAYPDLFAAVCVHSGLACGAAHDLASALAAMHQGGTAAPEGRAQAIPTIVFHGDQDSTVNPRNGDQVMVQAGRNAGLWTSTERAHPAGSLPYTHTTQTDASGRVVHEQWLIHGLNHAWSGGSEAGSFTDPRGPDASREMVRFFLEHPKKY